MCRLMCMHYWVQLSRFRITFVCRRHLSFMPLCYDTRNDVLLSWIGTTNCQPKWLRTRNAETQHEKNTLTADPIMLEDELWMRQREKPSPNCQSQYFENRTAETEFSGFECWGWFSSVFTKLISNIFIGFRTPYT